MEEEKKESPLRVELWSETCMEDRVYFQLIELEQSFFIWVGGSQGQFASLNVGIKTPMAAESCVSTLMGKGDGNFAHGLSQRLSQRFESIVVLSYNLPQEKDWLERIVEASIFKKIKDIAAEKASSKASK
mmetsp:Transcript_4093/g.7909  ORF Transcript_4093/g.7909 Transcript_4093/m.7909 type:complete len:130 (-) Transcript_4093:219-608(-)